MKKEQRTNTITVLLDSNKAKSKYPDTIERFGILSKKKQRIVDLARGVFDFAFSMDGKIYYVENMKLFSKNWSKSFDSVLEQAREMPKLYIGINNILSELEQIVRDTTSAHSKWMGEQWSKTDDIGEGLHNAPAKRVEAYIARHKTNIQYSAELSELKNIAGKLRGLLKAIEMQHSAVIAVIYYGRRSNDIFTSTAGSIVSTRDEKTNDRILKPRKGTFEFNDDDE